MLNKNKNKNVINIEESKDKTIIMIKMEKKILKKMIIKLLIKMK